MVSKRPLFDTISLQEAQLRTSPDPQDKRDFYSLTMELVELHEQQ
jgi:hypothetical protein